MRPRRVSWKELGTLYFPARTYSPARLRSPPSYTEKGRFPLHDSFFRKHVGRIKLFADVGCSLLRGAPTTIDARKNLGQGTEVYAVDVTKISKLKKGNLENNGIRVLTHSILESHLPFQCDALRLANFSQHLSKSERRRALVNCWKSLKDGGYLLGALVQAGVYSFEFILRKKGRGFEFIKSDFKWRKVNL